MYVTSAPGIFHAYSGHMRAKSCSRVRKLPPLKYWELTGATGALVTANKAALAIFSACRGATGMSAQRKAAHRSAETPSLASNQLHFLQREQERRASDFGTLE